MSRINRFMATPFLCKSIRENNKMVEMGCQSKPLKATGDMKERVVISMCGRERESTRWLEMVVE